MEYVDFIKVAEDGARKALLEHLVNRRVRIVGSSAQLSDSGKHRIVDIDVSFGESEEYYESFMCATYHTYSVYLTVETLKGNRLRHVRFYL